MRLRIIPQSEAHGHTFLFCLLNFDYVFVQIFEQIFGQVFDQVFGQGFDQVLGEGKNHKYSVQYYRDGKIQCTVLLGRKNLLHRIFSTKKKLITFFWVAVSKTRLMAAAT